MMLIKFNKFFQIFFGYILIASIIDIVITAFLGNGNGIFKMIMFIFFILQYEIIPHPTSELNPFAFGIIKRWEENKKS